MRTFVTSILLMFAATSLAKTKILCQVKNISKAGSQYSLKPRSVLLTKSPSGNGGLYFKADLQYEYLGLPGDAEPAKYVKATSRFSMDVTGVGSLAQAVSRSEKDQESTIIIDPFLDESLSKDGKFNSTLTLIAPDSYQRGSLVKIDSSLECIYK